MFRFIIPGFGPITVQASNKAEAIRRAQKFLRTAGGEQIPQEQLNAALDAGTQIGPDEIQPGDKFLRADSPTIDVPDLPTDPVNPIPDPIDTTPVGDLPVDQRSGGALGLDPVRDTPRLSFAAFSNALANRGLDVNGVLGNSLRGAFTPLNLIAGLGEQTGVIDPIGDQPGATQAFFENSFGSQPKSLTKNLGGNLLAILNAISAGGDNPLLAELRNPEFGPSGIAGSNEAQTVRELSRQAATSRLGGVAAQFLPSNKRFSERFDRQLAASNGVDAPDFFNFARSQFGV